MLQSSKYLIFLSVLICVFATYNFVIYNSSIAYSSIRLSPKAIEGETIWLQNNCNSCHQIYGLGGYLGPDLTNVYSRDNRGEQYIKTILNTGIRSMPKFNFTEEEKMQLVQYFKEIDHTGYYPDVRAAIGNDGWVTIKNKTRNGEK